MFFVAMKEWVLSPTFRSKFSVTLLQRSLKANFREYFFKQKKEHYLTMSSADILA